MLPSSLATIKEIIVSSDIIPFLDVNNNSVRLLEDTLNGNSNYGTVINNVKKIAAGNSSSGNIKK